MKRNREQPRQRGIIAGIVAAYIIMVLLWNGITVHADPARQEPITVDIRMRTVRTVQEDPETGSLIPQEIEIDLFVREMENGIASVFYSIEADGQGWNYLVPIWEPGEYETARDPASGYGNVETGDLSEWNIIEAQGDKIISMSRTIFVYAWETASVTLAFTDRMGRMYSYQKNCMTEEIPVLQQEGEEDADEAMQGDQTQTDSEYEEYGGQTPEPEEDGGQTPEPSDPYAQGLPESGTAQPDVIDSAANPSPEDVQNISGEIAPELLAVQSAQVGADGQPGSDGQAIDGQTGVDGQALDGQTGVDDQASDGQTGADGQALDGQTLDGQTDADDQASDGQSDPDVQAIDGQTDPNDQAIDGQSDADDQVSDGQTDADDQASDGQSDPDVQTIDGQTDPNDQALDGQPDPNAQEIADDPSLEGLAAADDQTTDEEQRSSDDPSEEGLSQEELAAVDNQTDEAPPTMDDPSLDGASANDDLTQTSEACADETSVPVPAGSSIVPEGAGSQSVPQSWSSYSSVPQYYYPQSTYSSRGFYSGGGGITTGSYSSAKDKTTENTSDTDLQNKEDSPADDETKSAAGSSVSGDGEEAEDPDGYSRKAENSNLTEGSTYDLSAIESSIGQYLQEIGDLVIYETNPNRILPDTVQVQISRNGEMIELEKDTDYTFKMTGNTADRKTYKYTIDQGNFTEEGSYRVFLISEDAEGGHNYSENKDASIYFHIDHTEPLILSVDPSRDQELANVREVRVRDNTKLSNIDIYIGKNKVDYEEDGEVFRFQVPENAEAGDVRVVARDQAGNSYERVLTNYVKAGKAGVRPAGISPLPIILLAMAAVIALFMIRRRRRARHRRAR